MECHKVVLNRLDQVEAADGLLEVLDSACGELADTKHRLRQYLAIVLAVGNHINGDTTRSLAYGVRLDVFEKLCNLKPRKVHSCSSYCY
mmetsp:Transcript_12598/g.17217  ORF Transcript_12598/g.17217 Transcript_12598/m.17217 type:complete len:89 (-) Transcript_12598:887-1153(-)